MENRFTGFFFQPAPTNWSLHRASSLGLKLLQVFTIACTFQIAAVQAGDHPLQVNDPTILLPVKSAQVVAGFAELVNHANSELRVTGVSSEAFDRSEIHRTVVENDIAKMRKQDAIVIPAHSTVTLEHGGLHIMLMQPKKQLAAGEEIVVQLELEDGKSLPVSFTVSTDIVTTGSNHGHGDHSDHGKKHKQTDKKDHNKHENH